MKKYFSVFLLFALLAGCRAAPAKPTSIVETELATPIESLASESAKPKWESLEALLSTVTAADIGYVSWGGPNEDPAAEELAPLVNRAAGHLVERDPLTESGTWTDTIWSLDFYIAPKDAAVYEGADAVHLYAGLTENVVEIFAAEHLPQGKVWVEDPELYQLLRTQNDREDQIVNETWYGRYRDIVDAYFDQQAQALGFETWELTEFIGCAGTAKADDLGVELFRMEAAFRGTDTEDTLLHLAGGCYVDSALRVCTVNESGAIYLVTSDGAPMAIARGEDILEALNSLESIGQLKEGWGD